MNNKAIHVIKRQRPKYLYKCKTKYSRENITVYMKIFLY